MTKSAYHLNLSELEPYEVGAVLLSVLAWPEHLQDGDAMQKRHTSICQLYIQQKVDDDPDWALSHRMKPTYMGMSGQELVQYRRELARAIERRRVASRMAIPFLREADGLPMGLPKGIKHLSINEMARFVSVEAKIEDPHNVEARIWRPSLPVIHIATALEIVSKEENPARFEAAPAASPMIEGSLSIRDLLDSTELIQKVAEYSEHFASLLLNCAFRWIVITDSVPS